MRTPAREAEPGSPTTVYRYVLPPIAYRRSIWPFGRRAPGPRTVPVENVRARIAYMLLVIFAGTILLTFVAAALGWASPSDIRQFEAPIVSAEVSLLGAVMGFYYASRVDNPTLVPPATAQDDDEDDE